MSIEPAEYARWRASPLGSVTERLEQAAILDLAGPLAGKRVLDVGCGDGTYAILAAERGATATGIDSSQAMLDAARRRSEDAGVRVELQLADVMKLPFPAASFDVVVAVTVLCFVRDVDVAVQQIARVLAPGGRLVLGELGSRSVWAARRRVRGLLGSKTWRSARFWTERDLRRLVERAGLAVENVRGSVYYPPMARVAGWLAPFDDRLGRLTTRGAAFIAIAAVKKGGVS